MRLPQCVLPGGLRARFRRADRPAPATGGEAASVHAARLARSDARATLTRSLFIALVMLPTVSATVFYGILAAPRYVSEARFVVRSVSSSRASGLDMLFRTFGVSRTVDDANLIQKYLLSRDIVAALQAGGLDLRSLFRRSEADLFSRYPRFWRDDTNEALYDYFTDHVSVVDDQNKGILTIRVVTFRAGDSLVVVQRMLMLAEAMVNRMNDRAQRDTFGSAQHEVALAEEQVLEAQKTLTDFRNREILFDPSKTTLSIIETVGTLSTDLAYASAELRKLQAQSPENPAISGLKAKIASLEERIGIERSRMTGGTDSLVGKISIYEQLVLRRDIADKSLATALTSLELARQEARRQHIYIEQVTAANLIDESTEPQRLRSIATVFTMAFAAFALTWILTLAAGEHSQ